MNLKCKLEGLSTTPLPNIPKIIPQQTQPNIYNPTNTPIGLPPPVFNQMAPRIPMHPQFSGGVGMHNLPPPTAFNNDPFMKQANPIEMVLIPEDTFLSTHPKHDITLKVDIIYLLLLFRLKCLIVLIFIKNMDGD